MKTQLDLKDINKIKYNGINVVSLFSGCGGSSLGYKLNGCKILAANEFDKEAQEVYELNHPDTLLIKEDIRKISGKDILKRVEIKKGELDILDGSPPCFKAGTLVFTSKGYKSIEDVEIGDMVLTHTNNFQKVTSIMNKEVNSYIKLKIQGSNDLFVTKDHPFYVRTMSKDVYQKRVFSEPYWKNTEDLKIVRDNSKGIKSHDYIGIAINTEAKLPEWNGTYVDHYSKGHRIQIPKKEINFNSESFWFIVGRYIADGWLRYVPNDRNDPKQKGRHGILFGIGKHKKESFEKEISKTQFNYSCRESRTTYKFGISNKELCLYLLQFGTGAHNKRLTSDILNLPINLLKSFLDGYLSGDGYYYEDINEWKFSSVSHELIVGLQHCIHKVYKVPTTSFFRKGRQIFIEGRKVTAKDSFGLRFKTKTTLRQQGFYDRYYLWVPFRKSETIKGITTVYNISVENDESYTVNNLICHNCAAFSSMGTREKHWGKEKNYSGKQQVVDDLFFEFSRILKEIKPKAFVAENVKGLTIGNAKFLLGNNQPTFIQEESIIQVLERCGYTVKFKILNSKNYDVPQTRERLIIIGIRNDLNKTPSFPKKTENKISTKDAIGDLIEKESDYRNSPKKQMLVETYFRPGCTLKQANDIIKEHGLKGVMMYYTRRDRWEFPFQTILQSGDRAFHPIKDRALSIDECKRLCTFPDDFILPHSPAQNWERLGRAVPPNLMMHVAKEVIKTIKGTKNEKKRTFKRTRKSKARNSVKRHS